MEILGFEEVASKTQTTEVNMDDLEHHNNSITVLGQILELKPILNQQTGCGQATTFDLEKTNKFHPQAANIFLHIPGRLVYGPTVVSTPKDWIDSAAGQLPPQTWALSNQELAEILDISWDSLNPDSEEIISNIEMLPAVTKSNS